MISHGPIRRLLIANRGEIAIRIIRAARDLGIETVVTHSDTDRDSLAVAMADRAVCVGPAAPRASYLNQAAILTAASAIGADAIHPGYGFLAENATFATAVEEAGIRFVGPQPDAVALMGNKIAARQHARRVRVPTIPGSDGKIDIADAGSVAESIGYPVILKAAGGGGGRGMRHVEVPEQLESVLASASAEASSAFGDGSIYVEKYLPNARHIEIQVVADEHGTIIHLGERDCTTQRRYQKVAEEGPSPVLNERVRKAMGRAAVRLCRNVGYRGLGTVEFLYDGDTGNFYFIEMNTRLQVEHPVTELLTGIDLVALQLRIAAGEPLPFAQRDVRRNGHAIEFRINAEDVERDFAPSAGRLQEWVLPGGPGVRVDTHCYPGYRVSPYYDSLLAKLIIWGEDRAQAIARSRRALQEFRASGVPTNASFQKWLVEQPAFIDATTSTRWAEPAWARHMNNLQTEGAA